MELRPFHLAIPVNDLQNARDFYGRVMGFSEGRSDERWIDWNCFGHQWVAHVMYDKYILKVIDLEGSKIDKVLI